MSGTPGTDVAIVGGGIMGSALAFWLRELDPRISVTVVERDPSYASASSALSAASIRQQYSTAINVRISQASIAFLRRAGELLAVDGEAPAIALREAGYLYLANASQSAAMLRAHAVQRAAGADVALFDPPALGRRFPWLAVDDLALGSLGLTGEGWFDGWALLAAMRRKARALGAEYLRAEVTAIERSGRRVSALRLADGTRLHCGQIVNAAGPWARAVAALAGVELPVRARCRTVYVCSTPAQLANCPLLIDPSGFWLRPEGNGYLAGCAPLADPDDAPLVPDLDAWEARLWPALASRIPGFAAARLERAWAGWYEYNTVDQNGIVGPHPDADGFWLLNGFSGHGLQQAPIVARGLAERIVAGRYLTLDLSALAPTRFAEGRLLREENVIG